MSYPTCPRASCRKKGEPHLVAVLARLHPEVLAELRAIRQRTRIPQAELLREAIGLLLAKYRAPVASAQERIS